MVTEGGNVDLIREMEVSRIGHLKYMSVSSVHRMHFGIEVANKDGSTGDVPNLILQGGDHPVVIFSGLVGCKLAGKEG